MDDGWTYAILHFLVIGEDAPAADFTRRLIFKHFEQNLALLPPASTGSNASWSCFLAKQKLNNTDGSKVQAFKSFIASTTTRRLLLLRQDSQEP